MSTLVCEPCFSPLDGSEIPELFQLPPFLSEPLFLCDDTIDAVSTVVERAPKRSAPKRRAEEQVTGGSERADVPKATQAPKAPHASQASQAIKDTTSPKRLKSPPTSALSPTSTTSTTSTRWYVFWTAEEDERLRTAVYRQVAEVSGYELSALTYMDTASMPCSSLFDWARIAEEVRTRDKRRCRVRWITVLQVCSCHCPSYKTDRCYHQPCTNSSPWTADEDQVLLVEMSKSHQTRPWGRVARAVGNRRTDRQCRARYLELNPTFNQRTMWTEDEDRCLRDMAALYRHRWTKISDHFITRRTDAQLRRRYVTLCNRQRRCAERASVDGLATEADDTDDNVDVCP